MDLNERPTKLNRLAPMTFVNQGMKGIFFLISIVILTMSVLFYTDNDKLEYLLSSIIISGIYFVAFLIYWLLTRKTNTELTQLASFGNVVMSFFVVFLGSTLYYRMNNISSDEIDDKDLIKENEINSLVVMFLGVSTCFFMFIRFLLGLVKTETGC